MKLPARQGLSSLFRRNSTEDIFPSNFISVVNLHLSEQFRFLIGGGSDHVLFRDPKDLCKRRLVNSFFHGNVLLIPMRERERRSGKADFRRSP